MIKARIILVTAAYLVLLWVLFIGIKRFERVAREAWYDMVTRRMVARQAHVPIEKCILGIYKPELPYSFRLLRELEDTLGQRFNIVSFYQAWGDKPENAFQPVLMENCVRNGCVPMVTWEPWVSGFESVTLKQMPQREWQCLRDIAGGAYDGYVRSWAKAAATWGKPFFLRFAHEMTNPQYPWSQVNGNTAADYRDAWWHVRAIFTQAGAHNAIWVWCPYGTNVLEYYPGDGSVDWTAMDIFNYGEILSADGIRRWMSFDELASPLYAELETIRKPIMVAEVGCSDIGGAREVWYREMLVQIMRKFSRIKAVVFFENPSDRTSGVWDINWSIGASADVTAEVQKIFAHGYFTYIQGYEKMLTR